MFGDGFVDEMIGMDMVDNGMMDMQEGMLMAQMGDPALGMMEMEIGQMQMATGEGLIGMGMMENGMGMGMGMGLGMGVGMGTGVLLAEQAMMARNLNNNYVCRGVGCTYPCCRPNMYQRPMINRPNYVNGPQNYGQTGYQQPQQLYTQQQFSQQSQPNSQQNQVLYSGHLYHNHSLLNWNSHNNACVTFTHFFNQSLHSITKLKIKTSIVHQNTSFLKTTTFGDRDHIFGCPRQEQLIWFCAIVFAKMRLYNHGVVFDQSQLQYPPGQQVMEGNLWRKSKHLGEWAMRRVRIDSEGLKSYRPNHNMHSTHIYMIPEMWTRFEIRQGGRYLVIKMKHNGVKYQYGVPIEQSLAWIRAFYSLMNL